MTEKEKPAGLVATQKARGVLASRYFFNSTFVTGLKFSHFNTLKRLEDEQTTFLLDSSHFVRPCPTRPRHGFVESRLVFSKDEAIKIFKEALEQDPDAELLVSKKIQGKHSAVYTGDGLLCIGPDHDGATSGKDTISMFICPFDYPTELKQISGIKENPYLEIVYSDKEGMPATRAYAVQLRDGPFQSNLSSDYIPYSMKIENVVEPSHDLLAWEEEVKNLPAGTAVYGAGHGLGSHAAVHCVINNVPFITSYKPEVGNLLEMSEIQPTPFDQKQFDIGFAEYLKSNKIRDRLPLSVSILHNWPRLQYSANASFLLGLMSGGIFAASVTAIFGEARHGEKQRNKLLQAVNGKSRDHVYESMDFDNDYNTALNIMLESFNTGAYSSGYGGPAWATCTRLTIELGEALFNKDQKNILATANKIINQSHNNGLFLDKFLSKSMFDSIAKDPALAFISYAPQIYELIKFVSVLDKPEYKYKKFFVAKKTGCVVFNGAEWQKYNTDCAIPTQKNRITELLPLFYGGSQNLITFKEKSKFFELKDPDRKIVWKIYKCEDKLDTSKVPSDV